MRLVAAAALVYLLVPGHPLAWLTGVPLGPLSLSCVVLVSLLVFAFWPTPPRAIPPLPGLGEGARGRGLLALALLATLIAAKLTLSWLAPAYGLPGWYYANGRFQGPPERSTAFRGPLATRRDQAIRFGADEFPVYFLNDSQRFNFFGPEAERRRNLPFSIRWQGFLYVPSDDDYSFWLTASGPATLALDGEQIAAVDAEGRDSAGATLPLRAGSHAVEIAYARRPPRSGDLKVEWEVDGRRQALGLPYLLAEPIDREGWQRDRVVGLAGLVVDGVFLASLGSAGIALVVARLSLALRRPDRRWPLVERPILAAFLLLVFAHASLPQLGRVDKMVLLGGGQDWLTHETLARDILLNGPLMTLGKPLGEGRAFYAQPFYPYALAAMHWLVGEDQFGPTVLQLLGLGLAGVLLYFIAKRLFGTPAAVGTLLVFIGLRAWQLDWVARRLLSEGVYFVVLPAALLCLLRYLDGWRRADLLLAALFLGLSVVTRGPTLLYLPLVGVLVWMIMRREGATKRRALAAVGALLAVSLAIVGLVPLRNLVVAGQPALVASSGGVNLEKLHRPTPKVHLAEASGRWYAPFVRDVPTREVLEFMLQDPLGYAASYVPLAFYTLGYGAAIDESNVVVWPDLVLLNLLYVGTLVCSRRARTARTGLLHAFIAVHFITMVVFAPYDYDNRLVLPMYLPMAVFAGFAVSSFVIRLAGLRRRPEVIGAASLGLVAEPTKRAREAHG
ncbi:MAG TPA: glycosyltransferase family 39 protein [Chloroflexota bacterium]|nr:glycosyltransferase family 39 protein [Chloroflexota bacterium]